MRLHTYKSNIYNIPVDQAPERVKYVGDKDYDENDNVDDDDDFGDDGDV